MTILGISIGTTRTGVCVIEDGKLLDRQIHNYDAVWSDTKLHVIINRYKRYVRKRNVDAIVVKVPPRGKQGKAIALILKRIGVLAKDHKCSFAVITRSEIKDTLKFRLTTTLYEYTRMLYPELAYIYEKGAMNEHSYYKKLFEAVLAAHVFQEEGRGKNAKQVLTTE